MTYRARLVPPGRSDPTADSGVRAPEEAASRQVTATREAMARLWADPERRARISAQMKARWAGLAYRERARGFRRDERTDHWLHLESGRIVSRAKLEMREEHGLRADFLDGLVAGRIQTSRGWRRAPRSLLGKPSASVSGDAAAPASGHASTANGSIRSKPYWPKTSARNRSPVAASWPATSGFTSTSTPTRGVAEPCSSTCADAIVVVVNAACAMAAANCCTDVTGAHALPWWKRAVASAIGNWTRCARRRERPWWSR